MTTTQKLKDEKLKQRGNNCRTFDFNPSWAAENSERAVEIMQKSKMKR